MGSMTAVREFLRAVWDRRPSAASYVECRDCGMTLAADATQCPTCGSEDLARYVLAEGDRPS